MKEGEAARLGRLRDKEETRLLGSHEIRNALDLRGLD